MGPVSQWLPSGSARENRLESGHVLLEEIPALAAQFTKFRTPAQIVISNVAGTRVRSTMIRVIEVWPDAPSPHWVIPQQEQFGIVNRYRNPAQLGSDRWAALIGARQLLGAKPALVVVCGTATTIDFLTADGVFEGGVILPGVGLDAARAAPAYGGAARCRRRIRGDADADRRRDRQRLPARAGRRDRTPLPSALARSSPA